MAGRVEDPDEADPEEESLAFCVFCEPLVDEPESLDADCVADEPELLVAGCVADDAELLFADDAEEDCVNGGRLLSCATTLWINNEEVERTMTGASAILRLICITAVPPLQTV